MGKQKRFQVIQEETPTGGMIMATVILLDTMTGVLYLHMTNGNGGGLTPLLDPEGKPIVWDSERLDTLR